MISQAMPKPFSLMFLPTVTNAIVHLRQLTTDAEGIDETGICSKAQDALHLDDRLLPAHLLEPRTSRASCSNVVKLAMGVATDRWIEAPLHRWLVSSRRFETEG